MPAQPDAVPFAVANSLTWPEAIASSPAAMLCCDPLEDRVLDCNPAFHGLLQCTREMVLARSCSSLFGQDLPRMISLTQACMDKGHYYSGDLSLVVGADQLLPVEIFASHFLDQGQPRLLLVMFDASEMLHQREQAERHWLQRGGLLEWKRIEGAFQQIERDNQLILSAAGEGIYGVNAEGDTTFVNPAALTMLGWQERELIGRDAHTVFHHTHQDGSHYPSHSCPIYAAFNDGIVHVVDNEVFWRKDGSHFPVEYTSTPIRDEGRLVGAVVVFRDVSERRDAEKRLRLALAEVESLKERLEMENAYLQEEIRAEHNYQQIVGRSEPIKHCIRQIRLVAPTDAPVLITGESGTGKELIARAIHQSSPRSQRPLIRVNCAAIPRDLFESEFFGHVRGAFTGATVDRPGRFELADGGTIFLDEVGELPLDLQGKLLRVLQDQQFERVGDTRTRSVNVRIIAATNRHLRELENIVERAVIVSAAGRLHIELPVGGPLSNAAPLTGQPTTQTALHTAGLVMTEQERRMGERDNIINALRQTQGKVAGREGAAALLGMKPPSLYSRLRRWHIDARAFN